MIVIDVRQLNSQKKYYGRLEFEYDAPKDLIEIPFVEFADKVKIDAEYDLYEDNSFEIKGKISYRIQGQCSRCLKDAAMDVEGDLDAYFQPIKDAEDYSYFGNKIDLREAIHHAIIESMPFSLSCKEGCEMIQYSDESN